MSPALTGRHACVTGGAGFIGATLARELIDCGCFVRVIDDLSTGDPERVDELLSNYPDRADFVHGSILDAAALKVAVEGCDTVFHLAARPSVPRSVRDPARAFAVNATGTLRVAEASRDAGVDRVIYSASSSAYGDQAELPKHEGQIPDPLSPYAASKLAGEQIMRAWAHTYAMKTASLRFFNVFGPHQPADSPYVAVVAIFSRLFLEGRQPTIYGDGTQTRDFTFVDNAVAALLRAATTDGALDGHVYNVGAGRRTSLLELARLIGARCGLSPEQIRPKFEDPRAGDVMHSQADLSRSREALAYEPIVTLEEGLDHAVEFYKAQLESERPPVAGRIGSSATRPAAGDESSERL